MVVRASTVKRTFFEGALVGYMVAIIATVIVMLVFDHGQPALLYLVPGVLLSVLINAFRKNNLQELWDFDEDKLLSAEIKAE